MDREVRHGCREYQKRVDKKSYFNDREQKQRSAPDTQILDNRSTVDVIHEVLEIDEPHSEDELCQRRNSSGRDETGRTTAE